MQEVVSFHGILWLGTYSFNHCERVAYSFNKRKKINWHCVTSRMLNVNSITWNSSKWKFIFTIWIPMEFNQKMWIMALVSRPIRHAHQTIMFYHQKSFMASGNLLSLIIISKKWFVYPCVVCTSQKHQCERKAKSLSKNVGL
jgi:hypothetical protein